MSRVEHRCVHARTVLHQYIRMLAVLLASCTPGGVAYVLRDFATPLPQQLLFERTLVSSSAQSRVLIISQHVSYSRASL